MKLIDKKRKKFDTIVSNLFVLNGGTEENRTPVQRRPYIDFYSLVNIYI